MSTIMYILWYATAVTATATAVTTTASAVTLSATVTNSITYATFFTDVVNGCYFKHKIPILL